ncbi:small subunit of acetolactate synthase-domain-containing protein [Chytridium lagenaria]|nr:small subunit of acetolactate synthase-domain-containing protein [Chytridium lagenaria]
MVLSFAPRRGVMAAAVAVAANQLSGRPFLPNAPTTLPTPPPPPRISRASKTVSVVGARLSSHSQTTPLASPSTAEDAPGVLSRVSGILAGRGFNIDSLVVSKTEVPDLSRMTIVLKGQASTIEQARRQLEDLVPVWAVLDYTHARIIERELILVKVSAVPHEHVADYGDEDVEVEGFDSESVERRTHAISPLMAASAHRQAVTELAKLFGAKVVDVSYDSLCLEMCSKPDKVDALLKLLKPYGIIEATRSGMMAMPRSPVDGLLFEESGEAAEDSDDGKVDASQLPPG